MKTAFTLVELIVVIAIIAALMALGLPVAKLAREHAAEATCRSNLRQMAAILRTYCNNYDGGFPDPSYLYHSDKSLDPNYPVTYRMGCRWHDARIGPASPLLSGRKDLQGALIPYLGNPKILLCKTGARVNREQGCHNSSPLVTYFHTEQRAGGQATTIIGSSLPHDQNLPVIPQYTYTMNGNLYRTFKTGSLLGGAQDFALNPKTARERQVRKEAQVARSPSEVFVFGEENSWAVGMPYSLSGDWSGRLEAFPDTTDDYIMAHEVTGTLTLGALDIAPSYVYCVDRDRHYAKKTGIGDAFATYHRPPGGDLNAGRSYLAMLDGHVREITVQDQLRKSRQIQGLPPSRLGPGGNLHLAWPLDVPPLGGWENQ